MKFEDPEVYRQEAERHRQRAAQHHARVVALQKEIDEDHARQKREHEEICRQRGLDGSVRSALIRAYIMGRAGIPICEEVLDRLMSGLEGFDVVRLDRKVVAMKRDLASLRREVEASRPNKVVALKLRDCN
jgi:hypothetical protein